MRNIILQEWVTLEYQLRVCPAMLGEGKALFSRDFHSPELKHLETKTYRSGLVLLRYEPVKKGN